MKNIFLFGTGLIGSTLLQQMRENQERIRTEGVELNVCGLANAEKMLIRPAGVNLESWKEALDADGNTLNLDVFIDALALGSVAVDCTASQEVADRYIEIARKGAAIVAANKKAQSDTLERYEELWRALKESQTSFLYETNVGAALPVIATLRDLVRTGDSVEKIEAILSGTLSYIFNTFSSSEELFSEIVRTAKQKGYTEPDPRDDLSGIDVARKAVILAREMGQKISVENIKRTPFLSECCFRAESVDSFFEELTKEDDAWSQRRDVCRERETVFRYIATIDKNGARITLQEIDARHPFYSMSGSDNIVSFTTARYCDTPLVIKGPGAGAQVTAAGVFADILRITRNP